jgi:hypothetical protein
VERRRFERLCSPLRIHSPDAKRCAGWVAPGRGRFSEPKRGVRRAAWVSEDRGTTWRRASATALDGPGSQNIATVAAFGSEVVAVGLDTSGQGKDPAAWTSSDGLAWQRAPTQAALSEVGDQEMVGIADVSGSDLVAVGTDGPDAAVVDLPRRQGMDPPPKFAGFRRAREPNYEKCPGYRRCDLHRGSDRRSRGRMDGFAPVAFRAGPYPGR